MMPIFQELSVTARVFFTGTKSLTLALSPPPKFLCIIPSIRINHLLVLFRNSDYILVNICPIWCPNDLKKWSMQHLGHVALCLEVRIAVTFCKGS